METYGRELEGLPNVTLLAGGPAAPWILGAELLVHTSCTTANEAFALGTPAINFEASPSPLHDEYFFSAQVSRRTSSIDTVVEWAGEVLEGKAREADWRTPEMLRAFHHVFAGQEGELSAAHIVRTIRDGMGNDILGGGWYMPRGFRRRRLWRKPFQRRIFPDIPAERLQERLNTLADLAGLPQARISRIGQALYHVGTK